jgi:gluconolactonase
VASEKGLPDGLKVNAKGYVFATGPGGVFIFNPSGKHLGTIKTDQATSNCAFNDDETVLFMTADSYVLSASLK